MNGIRLYSMAVCPFAQRTRILLKLKKIGFELTEIDITLPMPEWFLKLNPLGQVPVIQHHGQVLNESSVINEYIEDTFPSPPVFPADPYKKAISRILIDYVNHSFVPAMYTLLLNQERNRHEELTQKALETWAWLDSFLRRYNPEGTYLWDAFGMAELTTAPFFQRYCLNSYYRGFELPKSEEFKRIKRWNDALLQHPLVIETGMPDEHYVKLYEDYSMGYGNGKVPQGRSQSSFDLTIPLSERPMPARPKF